ncbi:DNA-binding FadR family transcriptional regulator [Bradyrhizobium japonicum]
MTDKDRLDQEAEQCLQAHQSLYAAIMASEATAAKQHTTTIDYGEQFDAHVKAYRASRKPA